MNNANTSSHHIISTEESQCQQSLDPCSFAELLATYRQLGSPPWIKTHWKFIGHYLNALGGEQPQNRKWRLRFRKRHVRVPADRELLIKQFSGCVLESSGRLMLLGADDEISDEESIRKERVTTFFEKIKKSIKLNIEEVPSPPQSESDPSDISFTA